MLDKKTWVLILINLHEIKTIFKSHIACFGEIIPESLVTHPGQLLFGIFLDGDIKQPVNHN